MTVASLIPFANKAFHIDDTFFLYVARQICAHPADPFGFRMNWYGSEAPVFDIAKSGPLTSYYLALAASCLGWSEPALHIAFLVPAVAAILGTYFLAARLCAYPTLAALATLFCPAFLVCSTNVMADTMTLALSVWSVALWLRSAESGSHFCAFLSACLIAAASVTRYAAIVSLMPLLLAYSLLRWPRVTWRTLYLVIPAVVFLAYDLTMRSLYGESTLFGACSYVLGAGSKSSCVSRGLITLSFMGGCIATGIFYAPVLWSRRVLLAGILGIALMVWLLFTTKNLGEFDLPRGDLAHFLIVLQFSIFVAAGVGLLALTTADLWQNRDAESALLVLWMVGTFVFCWLINWMSNARTILPLVPAANILIVRRIQRHASRSQQLVPLAFVALLAMAVAWADLCVADTARLAASEIRDRYGRGRGAVLFAGHWGFQYYMEAYGFKPIDYGFHAVHGEGTRVMPDDIVILPENNTNVESPPRWLAQRAKLQFVSCPVLATVCNETGADFHGGWGPLPFAIGSVPPERYYVMTPDLTNRKDPPVKQ
jgi:hypothetical protein